jgi:hypothetical protein
MAQLANSPSLLVSISFVALSTLIVFETGSLSLQCTLGLELTCDFASFASFAAGQQFPELTDHLKRIRDTIVIGNQNNQLPSTNLVFPKNKPSSTDIMRFGCTVKIPDLAISCRIIDQRHKIISDTGNRRRLLR